MDRLTVTRQSQKQVTRLRDKTDGQVNNNRQESHRQTTRLGGKKDRQVNSTRKDSHTDRQQG